MKNLIYLHINNYKFSKNRNQTFNQYIQFYTLKVTWIFELLFLRIKPYIRMKLTYPPMVYLVEHAQGKIVKRPSYYNAIWNSRNSKQNLFIPTHNPKSSKNRKYTFLRIKQHMDHSQNSLNCKSYFRRLSVKIQVKRNTQPKISEYKIPD